MCPCSKKEHNGKQRTDTAYVTASQRLSELTQSAAVPVAFTHGGPQERTWLLFLILQSSIIFQSVQVSKAVFHQTANSHFLQPSFSELPCPHRQWVPASTVRHKHSSYGYDTSALRLEVRKAVILRAFCRPNFRKEK